MLYLQFQIDSAYYLLESRKIKEVTPFLPLMPLPRHHDFCAGEFNFRGSLIPVIDFKMLLKGQTSKDLLSTRIAVIDMSKSENDNINSEILNPVQNDTFSEIMNQVQNGTFGIIAEKATETIQIRDEEFLPPSIKKMPFLGGIIIKNKTVYQKVILSKLFESGYLISASGQTNDKMDSTLETGVHLEKQ